MSWRASDFLTLIKDDSDSATSVQHAGKKPVLCVGLISQQVFGQASLKIGTMFTVFLYIKKLFVSLPVKHSVSFHWLLFWRYSKENFKGGNQAPKLIATICMMNGFIMKHKSGSASCMNPLLVSNISLLLSRRETDRTWCLLIFIYRTLRQEAARTTAAVRQNKHGMMGNV